MDDDAAAGEPVDDAPARSGGNWYDDPEPEDAATDDAASGERSDHRARLLTLLATILGSAITFLDMTVLSVALPTIADDLGFGLIGQQWVNVSYTIALTALYLLAGTVGDRLGQRRVFVIGTVGFAGASLLAGIAPDTTWLLVARVLQGAAAAFLTTTSLALLRNTWGDDAGRAIGLWTAGTSVATIAGPLVGGLLTDHVNWRWIFLINLPLAAAAIIFALAGSTTAERTATRDSNPDRGPLDLIGAAVGALAITGLTWFLVQGQTDGFRATWWAAAVAVAASAIFIARERSTPHPLLPFALFRERNFSVANLATLLVYAALGGSLFYLGLYLQSGTVGYSATRTGWWMMPVSIALVVFGARFGALADKHGPRLLLSLGPILMGFGMLCFMLVEGDFTVAALAAGMALFGLGLAMVVAPITSTALQAVPQKHSGVAAAVNTAVARLGGVIAVALMGVVITASFNGNVKQSQRNDGPFDTASSRPHKVDLAVIDAYRLGMLLAVGLTLAGGIVAALGIDDAKARKRRS